MRHKTKNNMHDIFVQMYVCVPEFTSVITSTYWRLGILEDILRLWYLTVMSLPIFILTEIQQKQGSRRVHEPYNVQRSNNGFTGSQRSGQNNDDVYADRWYAYFYQIMLHLRSNNLSSMAWGSYL